MSETAHQMSKVNLENREMNSITDNDDLKNLKVDSTMSSSVDTAEFTPEFISPRTLILESRSSEEEMTVTKTKVKSRHAWIEKTLLKDQKPLSETTRQRLSRHSLPATTSTPALAEDAGSISKPPRSSLGGSKNDVLARARAAIEGRKKSRETAKAKVDAALTSVGDDEEADVSISYSLSSLKPNEKLGASKDADIGDDIRAKARARLDKTSALLAGRSPARKATAATRMASPLKKDAKSTKEADNIAKDEPQRQRTSQAVEHDSLEARLAAKQAELEKKRLGQETVQVNKEQKDEEARRMEEVQAKAEKLRQERLAAEAAKQAEIERRIEQERALAEQRQKKEDARRSAEALARRLEYDGLDAALAAKQAELEKRQPEGMNQEPEEATKSAEELDDESTQASMFFDPLVNNTSSCSTNSGNILDKPSKSSDATSLGQVDRLLYQGKTNDMHHEEVGDLQQDDSEDVDFEVLSNSESGSQASNIVEMPDHMYVRQSSSISAGPMWKRAAAEAAYNTTLAKDFLPRDKPVIPWAESTVEEKELLNPTPSIVEDPEDNLPVQKSLHEDNSYSNLDSQDEEQAVWPNEAPTAEEEEEILLREFKGGFKRNRMIYMVAFGVLAGLFPSLYVMSSCHFITGDVMVGDGEEEFGLYYGLHRFTPVDSALQGHDSCQGYNAKYNYHPPSVPQVFGTLATIFGTIPLIVIGVYIRYNMTHKILWMGSMWMLYAGFVCQISTLSMLLMDLCTGGIECSMGPGAWVSVTCAAVWFLMSIEMKVNSPLIQPVVTSNGMVVIERDYLFISLIKKAWKMINEMIDPEVYKIRAPSLSKAAMKKQKGRIGKGEAEMGANYRPPEIV